MQSYSTYKVCHFYTLLPFLFRPSKDTALGKNSKLFKSLFPKGRVKKNCRTLDIVQTVGGGLSKHQLFSSMNVWTCLSWGGGSEPSVQSSF